MKKLLAALSAVALVSACAQVYEGRHDYEAGWRRATVLRVGLARQINEKAWPDCRSRASRGDSQQFAYVWFGDIRSRFDRAIVAIPPGGQLSEGEHVYVNIADCSMPMARVGAGR